jgi:hypothetical protein
MGTPNGDWTLANLPAFEELAAAVEQLWLEVDEAGQALQETGSLHSSGEAIDVARERLACAAVLIGAGPSPPDPASAWHLDAALAAVEQFGSAARFEDRAGALIEAANEYQAFASASAIANGPI